MHRFFPVKRFCENLKEAFPCAAGNQNPVERHQQRRKDQRQRSGHRQQRGKTAWLRRPGRQEIRHACQQHNRTPQQKGKQGFFQTPIDHEEYSYYSGRVQRSHNAQLQKLFASGIGIHHAGMRRADRSLVEEMFAKGVLRVICCTATLAWGVNLPAHGVIIKGTQLYDASRGGWCDVDILDVIQIFGRAGRPQFDTTGEGCIIGMHDSIDNFARLMVMKVKPMQSFYYA